MKFDKDIRELAIIRLTQVPSNVSFSIGTYGGFTRNQLIEEIKNGTDVGNAAVEMEILFIQQMPIISRKIAERHEKNVSS